MNSAQLVDLAKTNGGCNVGFYIGIGVLNFERHGECEEDVVWRTVSCTLHARTLPLFQPKRRSFWQ